MISPCECVMELAQEYGTALYTGVFYRNPNPPPTYGRQIAELQGRLAAAKDQPKVATTPIES